MTTWKDWELENPKARRSLKVGDRVRITAGPDKGKTGTIVGRADTGGQAIPWEDQGAPVTEAA